MTDPEHPEDEQRNDDLEAAAEEAPADSAEESADAAPAPESEAPPEPEPVPEPVAEAPPEPEPVAEAPPEPEPEPVAEAPPEPEPEPEPVAEAQPAPEPAAEPAAATEPPPPSAESAPAPAAADASMPDEDEEVELAPRQRPEIPGADLVPDLVSESDEFLDAEARAAAEAEAEAAAALAAEDQDTLQEAQPIADAAIDLAAGARYTATGKRKTAVARVILKPGTGTYAINGKELERFFPRETLQRVIRQPLEAVGYESRMDVVARMHGGGVAAQAGALRHGVARALLEADPNLRGELKRRGFLTRDPRVKERKKAGLKKARKRPQFSKR